MTPPSRIGEQHCVATRTQCIQVNIRHGSGVPLDSRGSVWASLLALSAVRQDGLIAAGIMNASLPHSRLRLHSGGHIDLVHNAAELAPARRHVPARTRGTSMSDNNIDIS
jgi:hypothetical protein